MATEVWYRDPYIYVDRLVGEGINRYYFTAWHLARRKIDVFRYMRSKFGHTDLRPEFMVRDQNIVAHYKYDSPANCPEAVWPIWKFTDPIEDLVGLIENPIGEMADLCIDEDLPPQERPRWKQRHMVVLAGIPDLRLPITKRLVYDVAALCREYTDCEFHLTDQRSFKILFGMDAWKSVDIDPFWASQSNLILPNGITHRVAPSGAHTGREAWHQYNGWIQMMGFSGPDAVWDRYDRAVFTVRAVEWAKKYYTDDLRVSRKYSPSPEEVLASDTEFRFRPSRRIQFNTANT